MHISVHEIHTELHMNHYNRHTMCRKCAVSFFYHTRITSLSESICKQIMYLNICMFLSTKASDCIFMFLVSSMKSQHNESGHVNQHYRKKRHLLMHLVCLLLQWEWLPFHHCFSNSWNTSYESYQDISLQDETKTVNSHQSQL